MKYRVTDTCIGCGLCTSICPRVFSMGPEGQAVAIEAKVNDQDAEEALGSCPVGAIVHD